jgi:DNA-binding transcriptional LysR family regulator
MAINPRTLKYVLTVAEEKSFSRAAEKLFISQPSLSQQILQAEKDIGVRFFNRDVIPLTLTYAGERYIAAARDFSLLEDRLHREMEDIAGNISGRIVVGASATRGTYIIPRLFAAFKKEYPQVELMLREGSNDLLLALVRDGQADFAFAGNADQNFEIFRLGDDRVLLAAPAGHSGIKKYAARKQKALDLRLFREEPFILLHRGQALRTITDRIFADYELSPVIAHETRNFDMAYRITLYGLGLTFVTSAVQSTSKDIVCFNLDRGVYPYPLLLVSRKNMYFSRPMQRFIALSQELYKQIAVDRYL